MGTGATSRGSRLAWAVAATLAAGPVFAGGDLGNVGSYPKWSKVEIDLTGPASDAFSGNPNPFEVDVTVTFTGPGGSFDVPAFFDGDGNGGSFGGVWRVRFSPDAIGGWTFSSASAEPLLDGYTGSFDVTDPGPCAPYEAGGLPDLPCYGRLQWVGEHYLKFADGPYWLKGGADDPEDLLADGVTVGFASKAEAMDYLAGLGINSQYFMTHNIGGDGDNVSPWSIDDDHFDLPRLAEWEELLTHMQSLGIVLHLVLEDDSGWTGFNRSLYYREMVARFGHHTGLIWNISEEYNENYSSSQAKSFAQILSDQDPYGHPTTVHNAGSLAQWEPFLGDDRFDLTSFQTQSTPQNNAAVQWWEDVEQSGRVVPMAFDETGNLSADTRHIIWSVYMGGANYELHIRPLDDFRDHEDDYEELTRARGFMEELPFWEMRPSNDLRVSGNGYVFAKPGEVYAAYLPDGGTIDLDLSGGTEPLDVTWFNPRTGARIEDGQVSGGGVESLSAPDAEDWALSLRAAANVAPTANDQQVNVEQDTPAEVTLSYDDPDGPGPYVFSVTATPANGILIDDDGDDTLVYTPDAGFFGDDAFSWQVDDGMDVSDIATVSVNVFDPTNTPPVADDQAVVTAEDSMLAVTLTGSDFDEDPLTYEIATPPLDGVVSGVPPHVDYTPAADFNGQDSFEFEISDDRGGSDSGTVSVTVLPVADPPVSHGHGVVAFPGVPLEITLPATDGDGDPLTYAVLSLPGHGALSGDDGDSVVTYLSDAGFEGLDSFSFAASDGTTTSEPAIVFVSVSMTAPLLDDDFDRPNGTEVANGWVELEAAGTSAELDSGRLVFAVTGDAANRPLLHHGFHRIASGALEWDFVFDWTRVGQEGTYRVFMQLGDESVMTVDDQDLGVGVNLVWTKVGADHQTLAYRNGGATLGLTPLSGNATVSVHADVDGASYEVLVDGVPVQSGIPFDQASALDAVRFFTDNVNQDNFSGRAFDDLLIRSIGESAGNPLTLIVTRTHLYWAAIGSAVGYDLIRGDLHALHQSGGDFAVATELCLAGGLADTSLPFTESPAPGEFWWFLVRGVDGGGALTYDTWGFGSNGQVASRDAGIEASGAACP